MAGPNIVLVHPVIPQNTGSIARLTAAAGVELHLIEPLGFELSDRYLKRAGLDYWPYTSVHTHASWESFLLLENCSKEQLWFFSTKADLSSFAVQYSLNDYLVFGSETVGLPPSFHEQYAERRVCIPMENENIRSLNLANAAGIALFEAKRQLKLV